MRAIKFRAWDFDKNKMFYGYELDKPNMIDFNGNVYKTGNTGKMCEYGCSAEYINKAENCVLMQFTGLLDKNGKEIYEADIVLYDRNIHKDIDTAKFKVVWAKDRYVLQEINHKYYIDDVTWELVEVIGNIYENPELLKENG